MKKSIWVTIFCTIFAFCTWPSLFAQVEYDIGKECKVFMVDGSQFVGILNEEDAKQIELETQSMGRLTILRNEIDRIEYTDGKVQPGARVPYHTTRYNITPSGYGLKKGEGYYQNTAVLMNQVVYGFSDYFSMGAGMIPLFLFQGAPTPVWVTPKFSIPLVENQLQLGIGSIIGSVLGDFGLEGAPLLATLYGELTVGSPETHFTIGWGRDFANSGPGGGIWTLSGLFKLSNRTYLMTENFYLGGAGVISLGARTVWDSIALNYGLFAPISSGDIGTILLPQVGILVPFQ